MNILVSLRPTWLIQKAFFGLGFITPLHNSGAFLFDCVAQPLTSVHAFQKCCVALYPEIAKIREESPVYALSHSVNFHPPNIVLFYWDASPVCKQLQYTAPSKLHPTPPSQTECYIFRWVLRAAIHHSLKLRQIDYYRGLQAPFWQSCWRKKQWISEMLHAVWI